MKKKQAVIISFCTLSFLSCKTSETHLVKKELHKEKKEWVFAFKSMVFYECLKHSGIKIEKDASPSLNFEVLGNLEILSKTDSVGRDYSKLIDERSVWLKGGDLDGYKAITNGCLSFFESRELESLANAEYDFTFNKKQK